MESKDVRRIPKGKSPEKWAGGQVDEAIRRGDFDDLPGKGKPLQGLSDGYDPMWWVKDKLRREGVSMVPETMQLRREVEAFYAGLAKVPSEAALRSALDALNARIRKVNSTAISGPPSTLMPLEFDRVLTRWREARGQGIGSSRVGGSARTAGRSRSSGASE